MNFKMAARIHIHHTDDDDRATDRPKGIELIDDPFSAPALVPLQPYPPSVRAVCVASREDLSASKCCERLCVMVFFPSASFSSCSASSFCCTPHFSFTLPGSGWGGGVLRYLPLLALYIIIPFDSNHLTKKPRDGNSDGLPSALTLDAHTHAFVF